VFIKFSFGRFPKKLTRGTQWLNGFLRVLHVSDILPTC
jgi:hypothetical protein